MKKIKILLLSIGLVVASTFAITQASSIPVVPSVFETYVAAQQGSTDTSITLASNTLRDSTLLSGYVCLTIDSNTPTLEYECGTAATSSLTITNLVRGIDPLTGTTSVTALQFSHRRGADAKVTDYPILALISRMLNGLDTIPGAIQYSSTVSTTTLATNRSSVASVGLVQDTAFSGAGIINATTAAKGIVQIATATQAASTTVTGSSGANLVLPSAISTSTAGTASQLVPVTKVDGTLDQGFLPSTISKSITFSGAVTFSSTTSGVKTKFGGNGTDGVFASSTGTTTIDLQNAPVVIKNYSSFTLSGTAAYAFTNPNTNGTIIILKVQNNFVCTSTAAIAINAVGMGSAGGAAASGTATPTSGSAARTSNQFSTIPVSSGTSAGTAPISLGATPLLLHSLLLAPGAGGGGGGQYTASTDGGGGAGGSSLYTTGNGGTAGGGNTGGTIAGAGSRGGGALYIETGGSYTNSCVMSTAGVAGVASGSSGSGGGGGGSGGSLASLYNTLVSDTGTYTVSGGTGGVGQASGNHAGGTGAIGTSTVGLNTEF